MLRTAIVIPQQPSTHVSFNFPLTSKYDSPSMSRNVRITMESSSARHEAILRLNRDAGIDILDGTYPAQDSVRSTRIRVSRLYAYLFDRRRVTVDKIVSAFLEMAPTLPSADERYDCLLTALQPLAAELNLFPQTDRRSSSRSTMIPSLEDSKVTRSSGGDIRDHFKSSKQDIITSEKSPISKEAPTMLPAWHKTSRPAPSNSSYSRTVSIKTSFASTARTSFASTCSNVSHEPPQTATTSFASDVTDIKDGGRVSDTSSNEHFPSVASDEAKMLEALIQSRSPSGVIEGRSRHHVPQPFHLVAPDASVVNSIAIPITRGTRSPTGPGFVKTQIPPEFSEYPLEFQLEVQRLLQTGSISPESLIAMVSSAELSSLYDAARPLQPSFDPGFDLDKEGRPVFTDLTLRISLQWTETCIKPLFQLRALTPFKGKTSALQRKYGTDRILYVDMPALASLPNGVTRSDAMTRVEEWLIKPHFFLGRNWSTYVLKPSSDTKTSSLPHTKPGTSRLILFAWDETTTIVDALAWALPLPDNAKQAARKGYARLDLQISRTTPTVTFEPSEIDFGVDDLLSSNVPEHDPFADPRLTDLTPKPDKYEAQVMNDGCARMSYWVALQCQEALGLTDVPSVVQGRIAGCKGLWFVDTDDAAATATTDGKPPGKLIEITKSQVKVLRPSLEGCDPSILTLNVVNANSPPRPGILYFGYIPILLDRGVPKEAIFKIVEQHMKKESEEYLNALRDPDTVALRCWIHSQQESWEDLRRDSGIKTFAKFPVSREERAIMMLEQGFNHKRDFYVSREIYAIGESVFNAKQKNLKIKLPQSTSLMGIADPTGVLEYGEIQVSFSARFKDSAGTPWRVLRNVDVLVARNPALAPWDMHKVRVVYRRELAHLTDVVVFSSKGRSPLAGKLQGGDYDGDTFWICWEPTLVKHFLNAPVPRTTPSPDELEIAKYRKTVGDFIDDPDSEEQCCRWLGKMASARMKFDLLGSVTYLHERLVYAQGRLDSEDAIRVVHLHDYLVDADKQGYLFDDAAFKRFKTKFKVPRTLPEPLYWQFTKADEQTGMQYPEDDSNAIDYLYFKVIQPVIVSTLRDADRIMKIPQRFDMDLFQFYFRVLRSPVSPIVRNELRTLKKSLVKIRKSYTEEGKQGSWNESISRLRQKYDAIQPQAPDDLVIREWLRSGCCLTIWEMLKASAFATHGWYTKTPSSLIFGVAGYEMCILKEHQVGLPTRHVGMDFYNAFKVRMDRKRKASELEDNDEEAGETSRLTSSLRAYCWPASMQCTTMMNQKQMVEQACTTAKPTHDWHDR